MAVFTIENDSAAQESCKQQRQQHCKYQAHVTPTLRSFLLLQTDQKMESYEPPKNAYKALNFWLASGGPSPQRRTGKVPLSLLRHEEE
jgi:hypothetical protein